MARKRELFHIDLELGGGSLTDRITMFEGDSMIDVVKEFCGRKGLNQVIERIIYEQMIDRASGKYNNSYPAEESLTPQSHFVSFQPTQHQIPQRITTFPSPQKYYDSTPDKENRDYFTERYPNDFSSLNKYGYQPVNSSTMIKHMPKPDRNYPTSLTSRKKSREIFQNPQERELFDPLDLINTQELFVKPEKHPGTLTSPKRKVQRKPTFIVDQLFGSHSYRRHKPAEISSEHNILLRPVTEREELKTADFGPVGDRLYQSALQQQERKLIKQHAKYQAEQVKCDRSLSKPRIDNVSKQLAEHHIESSHLPSNVFSRLVESGSQHLKNKNSKIEDWKKEAYGRENFTPTLTRKSTELAARHKLRTSTDKSTFDRLFDDHKDDKHCHHEKLDNKPRMSSKDFKSFLKRMEDDVRDRVQRGTPSPRKRPSIDRARSKASKDSTDKLYLGAFEIKDKKKQAEELYVKEVKELASKSKITKKSEEIVQTIIKQRMEMMFKGFDNDADGMISFENIKSLLNQDMRLPDSFKKTIGPFLDLIVERKMTLDSLAFEYSLKKFVKTLTIDEKRNVLCLDYLGKTAFKHIAEKVRADLEKGNNLDDIDEEKSVVGVSLVLDDMPQKDIWNADSPQTHLFKEEIAGIDEISVASKSIPEKRVSRKKREPTTLSRLLSQESSFSKKR